MPFIRISFAVLIAICLIGAEPIPTKPGWAKASGTDAYGVWADMVVGKQTQRMRWIPAGTFRMGTGEEERKAALEFHDYLAIPGIEQQHDVTLTRGYWLGDSECTQALWLEVMGANPAHFADDPLRPIESMSWVDVTGFLERLNKNTNHVTVFRLPTEAEWEYACRAGTTTTTYAGDMVYISRYHVPILDAIAWYGGNSGHGWKGQRGDSTIREGSQYPYTLAGTWPVKKRKPNAWGLYDMLGNVSELCSDSFELYPSNAVVDPRGPVEGNMPVARGGSWENGGARCRSASRLRYGRDPKSKFLGFRFAAQDPLPRTPVMPPVGPPPPKPVWATAVETDAFGYSARVSLGGNIEQIMRWIPPGAFTMGATAAECDGAVAQGADRKVFVPEATHRVTLTNGFWLAEHECTQGFWQAVEKGENPSDFRGDDRLPVDNVSWIDVQRFLKALNVRFPGAQFRLPTEAEWEFSARAGTTSATYAGDLDFRTLHDVPVLDPIAWYTGNCGYGRVLLKNSLKNKREEWPGRQYPNETAGPRLVKLLRPNAWGLYDMLGNVEEWCSDWFVFVVPTHVTPDAIDPQGPKRGTARVIRGGSWWSMPWQCRSAFRTGDPPKEASSHRGFRFAASSLDVKQDQKPPADF